MVCRYARNKNELITSSCEDSIFCFRGSWIFESAAFKGRCLVQGYSATDAELVRRPESLLWYDRFQVTISVVEEFIFERRDDMHFDKQI